MHRDECLISCLFVGNTSSVRKGFHEREKETKKTTEFENKRGEKTKRETHTYELVVPVTICESALYATVDTEV